MATRQQSPDTKRQDASSDTPRRGTPHRRRSRQAQEQAGRLDLLEQLLAAPPASGSRRRPVALRSAAEQRRHALRGYRLRTWVDQALHQAERLLMVVALLVFGYWLVDGPVRDWLHARQAPSATRPVSAAALVPLASSSSAASARGVPARDGNALHSAPLPYVNPQQAAPGSPAQQSAPTAAPTASALSQAPSDAAGDDFIAPRQRPLNVPIAAAPPQPTRLIMPSIGVDTPVQEVFIADGAWQVAEYAAGYLHGTGLPGDGNTVLAGHAGLRGAVFRDLGSLSPNDDVYLDAGGWRFHYRVRETKAVWPEQVEVLDPTTSPVLTMLTCTNWDTQRLVVVADLVDSQPSPSP